MFSFLNRIPDVTKNLLLINIVLYLASHMLSSTGAVNLFDLFSSRYVGTPFFEPFQIVTHMFMHSARDIFHLVFNMLILVMFGAHLERHWGAKKFFIFYMLCGLGAFAIENIYYGIEIYKLKDQIIASGYDLSEINYLIPQYLNNINMEGQLNMDYFMKTHLDDPDVHKYFRYSINSGLGASGALFGVLGAFALLFPNTELMLLFIPVPVKAKYLIGAYILFEVYRTFNPTEYDNVNHLAHISGAAIGLAYVLINRKLDRSNFY